MNAPVKVKPLRLICISSEIANEVPNFRVQDHQYRIDESVVARALNLSTDNFVPLPSNEQLYSFFQIINYQGQIDMTRLSKSNLVTEWDCYFDSLAKAFANCTKTSFHNIPSQLMYIGYVVAHNLRINFAQLIWTPMVRRLIAAKRNMALGNKINCYYTRFFTLILNHILSSQEKSTFDKGPFEVSQTTHKIFYTQLHTSNKFTGIPVVITPYMSNYINLSTIQPHIVQPTEPLQPEQPPVDPFTQASSSAQSQVLPPISGSNVIGSQEDVIADQGIVEPQSPSLVIERNTESNTPSQSTSRPKLPFRRKRSDKVGV